jgi:hypothetical protein
MKVKTNVNGVKAMGTVTAQGAYNYGSGTMGGIVNRTLLPLAGLGSQSAQLFYGFFQAMTSTDTYNYVSSGLYFMKGTPPTQAEFDTWYGTGATNVTADSGIFRATDLLIKYPTAGGNWNNGNLVVTFNPTVAANTGTATWYMFGGFQNLSNNVWARPTDLLIGTVSAIGGGGDIELLNTSIVSGTTYRIPQYEMRLPTKFNV